MPETMITSVEIERLRGIREGKLEDLRALTVLVGLNGSGKSTVLDALLLGAHDEPGVGIGVVGVRRRGSPRPARWLFTGGQAGSTAVVRVRCGDSTERSLRMEWHEGREPEADEPVKKREREQYGAVVWWAPADDEKQHSATLFAGDDYRAQDQQPIPGTLGSKVRFLDAMHRRRRVGLPQLLRQALELGTLGVVKELLASALPGFRNAQVLPDSGTSVLYLELESGALPVEQTSDGIRWVTTLCFELAIMERGLLLIEEPETHLHPGFMALSARAIVAAVRAGAQVVLSTHSLEFIDHVAAAMRAEDITKLAVHQLSLEGGVLVSSPLVGEDVAFTRFRLDADVR